MLNNIPGLYSWDASVPIILPQRMSLQSWPNVPGGQSQLWWTTVPGQPFLPLTVFKQLQGKDRIFSCSIPTAPGTQLAFSRCSENLVLLLQLCEGMRHHLGKWSDENYPSTFQLRYWVGFGYLRGSLTLCSVELCSPKISLLRTSECHLIWVVDRVKDLEIRSP